MHRCKLLPRSGASLTVVDDRVYLFGGTVSSTLLMRQGLRWSMLVLASPASGASCIPCCPQRLSTSHAPFIIVMCHTQLQEPISGACYNDLKVLDVDTWTWSDVEVGVTSG